jgi:hypothetical protein
MNVLLTRVATAGLLCAFWACGGSGSSIPTNQIVGTIGSQSFAAKDATSVTGTWSGFVFNRTSLAIEISDYAGQCAYDGKNQAPPNSQQFVLVLANTDASGNSSAPTSPGVFPVITGSNPAPPNALSSQAWYERGGSGASGTPACFRATSYGGVSGTVVVSSVSSSAVTGTFDVILSSGDHITGSFNAPTCAGLNLNTSPTCP